MSDECDCSACAAIAEHDSSALARKAAESAALRLIARVMQGQTPQRVWRGLCLRHRERVMDVMAEAST